MWAVIPVWNSCRRSMKAQQMGTLCQPPGSPFSVQASNSAAACWWITMSHGELSSAWRRQMASVCFTQSLSELEEVLRSFVTVAVQQCRSTLSCIWCFTEVIEQKYQQHIYLKHHKWKYSSCRMIYCVHRFNNEAAMLFICWVVCEFSSFGIN